MKNIIKTAICLIVISSILLYSSVSKAATVQNVTISIRTRDRVNFISSEFYTDDNGNSFNYFTYSFSIEPYLTTSVDTYKNGRFTAEFTIDNYLPTGGTLTGISYDYDEMFTNEVISYGTNPGINGSRTYRVLYFLCNYGLESQIPSGNITVTVTFSISGAQWANFDIQPTVVASIYSSNLTANSKPELMGMGAIFKEAITSALHDGELDLVYDYLVFWKTTQDSYLADIELSVDDIELWLSYINSAQATLQNKVDLIYTLEQTFPGYFGSIITLLQDIKNMNASDTAAESQMQNAEQQLSQAVNNMEVQKPNINNVVNAGDQYMDSNITGAQGDTFFWLHGTNIFVTILTMAVTIGILGFIIYGKSG